MRAAEFDAESLQRLLVQRTACSVERFAEALGTRSRKTMFHKLAQVPYPTSYSRPGRDYTLRPSCRIDVSGLWSHLGMWFSQDGTLLATSERFVEQVPTGYSAQAFDNALHVQTRQSLSNQKRPLYTPHMRPKAH